MEVMKALYLPDGGSPRAFMCNERKCGAVTRTQKGMWSHLRIVHKVKRQADMVFETKNAAPGTYMQTFTDDQGRDIGSITLIP